MTRGFKIVSTLNLLYMIIIFCAKYALLFDSVEFKAIGALSVVLPILLFSLALFVLLANNKQKSNNIELLSGIILYVLLITVLLRSLIDQSLVIASVYYPVLLNYYANILVIPASVYAIYILIMYSDTTKKVK